MVFCLIDIARKIKKIYFYSKQLKNRAKLIQEVALSVSIQQPPCRKRFDKGC
jgi:hypothetical protein